ncbi:hypothetical protein KUTeg_021892, partial [Tegillarca granosa]
MQLILLFGHSMEYLWKGFFPTELCGNSCTLNFRNFTRNIWFQNFFFSVSLVKVGKETDPDEPSE